MLPDPDRSIVVAPDDSMPARRAGEAGRVERDDSIALGSWWWVRTPSDKERGVLGPRRADFETPDEFAAAIIEWAHPGESWLGCVAHVGSNYVELQAPSSHGGAIHERVHFDNFNNRCTPEPNATAYIAERIAEGQSTVPRLIADAVAVTSRLGVGALTALESETGSSSKALATLNASPDPKAYKSALIRAKDQQLPEIFKAIEEANEELARWMTAPMLPLKIQAAQMKDVIEVIEGRVFTVELYAGLCEEVVEVAAGEPAGATEPVHVFQRQHYMDEECLVQYEAGGMKFSDIKEFDAWIARPQNRDRILPFPRTIVAFRVRRHERAFKGDSLAEFLQFIFERDADKSTFLYLRNGDRLYRMSTSLDFGEKLFPDTEREALAGHVWAEMFGDRVNKLMRDSEYQALKAVDDEMLRAWEAAVEQAKREGEDPPWRPSLKLGYRCFEPFDPSSVHFDDIAAKVREDQDHHNRVALILQGLLDRSPVFHPHPPWQIWMDEGFRAGIKLMYDSSFALVSGAPPDFEAYRARLNASLEVGAMTIGQQEAWIAREREKDSNWSGRRFESRTFHTPYNDDGPGKIARVDQWQRRAKKATFVWTKEPTWRTVEARRRDYRSDPRALIPCSIMVPVAELLNVSAYTPGDFRQFYADPRTRGDYLKWARYLLTAEDYYAKKKSEEPCLSS